MPSTRDIRRRIKSVKNTSQITKAMQMVAASKMRKAQQAALSGRPYATLMNQVLGEVTANVGDFTHPLMEENNAEKALVIIVSTDKGLCGALNGYLMREVSTYDSSKTIFVTAGRKASQFVARTKRQLVAEFTYKDAPLFSEARTISKFAQDMFLKGEISRVDVLFTNFVSTLVQTPEVRQFLPLREIKSVDAGIAGHGGGGELSQGTTEFIFEPGAEEVLGSLLPHYLNYLMYQVLLESKASEHSARMVAMKNATDNAKQMIKDLTLEYNKLRQANITRELLEITTAQMALG